MAENVTSNLLMRLRFTPCVDLLRGNITGRLDWKRHIAASGLPSDLQAIVRDVISRTRIWRREKTSVADELIAHFLDGLDAGESSASLIERFGNHAIAARLIRRSTKRKRSAFWKYFWRPTVWTSYALFGFYALLAVEFFARRPIISIDYLARLNAPLAQHSEQDFAWPIYHRLNAELEAETVMASGPTKVALLDAQPGWKHWPETVSWLDKRAPEIAELRQATLKPALGYRYELPAGQNTSLIQLQLSYLSELRSVAGILAADARLSASRHQADAFVQNLLAIHRLAQQNQQDHFIITNLVNIGLYAMAIQELGHVLADDPHLLSDAQLQQVAHAISKPDNVADLISFTDERMYFDDIVQHIYGADGHVTYQGLKLFQSLSRSDVTPDLFAATAGPATVALIANRSDMLAMYDQLMSRMEANLHRPMYEYDDAAIRQISMLKASIPTRIRYALIVTLVPSLQRCQITAERYIGSRDGLVIGMAAEAYQRAHGKYPDSLAKLAPEFLPAVPRDRLNGGELRYKLVDGKPLVYSVGDDGIDNGGTPPIQRNGTRNPFLAAQWDTKNPVKGDWVLYPPETEREEEESN